MPFPETTRISRAKRERSGRRAEWIAAWWLRLHGWRVLGWRCRTPVGEVDLLVRRRHVLACVEVKYRTGREALDHAIDRPRLVRVAAAAEWLARQHAAPEDAIRIDVMLIAPWRRPRHLANVWHG